jgi:deazaflavin-dependent oxidoreductase (nitroreductase family)
VPSPKNIRRIGRIHALLYQLTNGFVGKRMDGLDILLLTTTGKKTGQPRRVPLPYFNLLGKKVLVASYGGNPRDPAWLNNLRHAPRVLVQEGARRWQADARIVDATEHALLWTALIREFPRYATYQARTPRLIPLVALEPAASRPRHPPAPHIERVTSGAAAHRAASQVEG